MPTCLTCQSCNLKSDPAMARLGWGHCEKDTQAGKFRAFEREIECDKFERLSQDLVDKRVQWASRR
ncbi:hypothetical protein [Cupriavidus pauculus]|uniref:Uncharacterized protein n=1 Tax=Cupriavidus pauculus TaxID=82633 RepID=A0A3G8H324_9BURK|nr:hypothetical protein [Cupriavidus pauculus]AZG14953.1 hypothetical protein EHF44_16860 [Cupriavidus pauculus]